MLACHSESGHAPAVSDFGAHIIAESGPGWQALRCVEMLALYLNLGYRSILHTVTGARQNAKLPIPQT
jgi:hypothetical protein